MSICINEYRFSLYKSPKGQFDAKYLLNLKVAWGTAIECTNEYNRKAGVQFAEAFFFFNLANGSPFPSVEDKIPSFTMFHKDYSTG